MVDLKTAAVVAGAGAAGIILLKSKDGGVGITMPDIKMPDITVSMPDIKMPDFDILGGFKMPTTEDMKAIFAAPLAGITEKIPTLDSIKEMSPDWMKDPTKLIDYLKEQFPDYLKDPSKIVDYAKDLIPTNVKYFASDPVGVAKAASWDLIGGTPAQWVGGLTQPTMERFLTYKAAMGQAGELVLGYSKKLGKYTAEIPTVINKAFAEPTKIIEKITASVGEIASGERWTALANSFRGR